MIILVRHATPLIDYSKCNVIEAQKRLIEYNSTTNIEIS